MKTYLTIILIFTSSLLAVTSTQSPFPSFAKTPIELKKSAEEIIKKSDDKLQTLIHIKDKDINFNQAILPLDDILFDIQSISNQANLLSVVSPDPLLRQGANEIKLRLNEWLIDLQSKEEIFHILNYCLKNCSPLEGEEKRLVEKFSKEFKRRGVEKTKEEQIEIQKLLKEIKALEQNILQNIRKSNKESLSLSENEMQGIPQNERMTLEKKEGNYFIHPGIASELEIVLKYGKQEEVRKKIFTAYASRSKEANAPLIKKTIQYRNRLAKILGYQNWADYKIEPLMMQKGSQAFDFISQLSLKLKPKIDQELEILRNLKIKETGNQKAQIFVWDIPYYKHHYLKEKYDIDSQVLKNYFSLDKVLSGMYQIYEQIFQITIKPIEAPYVWHPDVTSIQIEDAITHKVMGHLYLDLFPRPQEEKYGHFALFHLIDGKKGVLPTAALVGNFPRPTNETPSLLSLREVEILFHEFGHGLHTILSQSPYMYFSSTKVSRDFLEAPSQLLESWVTNKEVLDTFAVHYKKSGEKISKDILDKLYESENAFNGLYYGQQLAYTLIDFELHGDQAGKEEFDPIQVSNRILKDSFLSFPEGSSFITSFGHLFNNYDAAYYSYTWSKSLAIDMVTVFEKSSQKFFDVQLGLKLRKTIYEVGGSRDEIDSIKAFLGRDPSPEPFLIKIGIDTPYKK